jgi:hypothetical protein
MLARLGLNPRAYRTDGKPASKLIGKIEAYCEFTAGKSEDFWNDWCDEVAQAYERDAHEISAIHVCFLPKENAYEIPF